MGMVECQLCPKYCRIAPGRSGDCRVRVNVEGRLTATTWGLPCAAHVDPIEKKPLFHFLPGTTIFSLATAGCNMHCRNCQNAEISQANPEDVEAFELAPAQVVEQTKLASARSVAFTYTEPIIYYEYTYDACVLAREAGLKNVLVTAGLINERPLRELLRYVDAATIDLKAFNDAFYKENCGGMLKPVLRTLEVCVEMGIWLEVSTLTIPTLTDDPHEIEAMCRFVARKLGPGVPFHFLRFFPRYRLRNLPPTPGRTLEQARDIALQAGLRYVYVGNLASPDGENTWCHNPDCPEKRVPLIERAGYMIERNRITRGRCPACGTPVAGVWEDR
jgi:pyruvate formate lyase activating enzyme